MRRKIIIVIVVVVLVIVATITFFVIKDLQQEKSLRKEIDEASNELWERSGGRYRNIEQIDVDKISKKLKATVTTGDYAKIEKAIKNYMADNLNTMLTISEALNDEVIPNALTAENYQNDGPDFVKTRKILKNTQDKLSASKETMIILSKDDTVMSYLKNVDDSYYIDLYKEMVGEESSVDDIKKNIDDIVNLIQSQQNVLEFLSENKNMWNVQNGKIQFDDDILLNQYNQLLLAVQ